MRAEEKYYEHGMRRHPLPQCEYEQLVHQNSVEAFGVSQESTCANSSYPDPYFLSRITSHSEAPLRETEHLTLLGGPTSTDSVLAIGRADGAVHLYDSVGLLVEHKVLNDDGEKIINVEWVKGPSPRPISETLILSNASQAPSVSAKSQRRKPKVQSSQSIMQPALTNQAIDLRPLPARQFTIHPDETEDSTVRHTPIRGNTQAPPADNGAYLDLFSPVKTAESKVGDTEKRRVASPPRSRPRLSSQTFIRSPEPGSANEESNIAKPRNITLFPSTDDGDDTISPTSINHMRASTSARVAKPTASAQKQRITWKPSERRRSRKSIGLRTLPAQQNSNARVLADLRKMSTMRTAEQAGGVLSAFRTTQANKGSAKGKGAARNFFHRPTAGIETDLESLDALREYDIARREKKWIEDSEQDDTFGGDIWLTSDSGRGYNTADAQEEIEPCGKATCAADQSSKSHFERHDEYSRQSTGGRTQSNPWCRWIH